MVEIRNIGILGIGGVGSLLASRLYLTKHKLFCLGSEESNIHIKRNGIQVKSNFFGDSLISPSSIEKVNTFDILFLTVKGPNLISSLKSYKYLLNKNTVIVSLLNGMDYGKLIRNNFNLKIIIGSIGSLEVFLNKNRVAIHKSNFKPKIELASSDTSLKNELFFIKNLLNEIGINTAVLDDENIVIWNKLARLSVTSAITSMNNSSIGLARSNNLTRDIMLRLIDEIYLITSTLKIKINPDEILDSINSLPYDLKTSMQRDIESNKSSEIDFILKAPLKFGKKVGLRLPVMTYCYESLIQKIQKGSKYESR